MRTWILLCLVSVVPAIAQQPQRPCDAPEARQLDFWLGDWDLTWQGGHGTNKITRILDGCVIQESFRMVEGGNLVGHSVSSYDPRTKLWKQTWVDNTGTYLDFEGEFDGETMTLGREFTRGGQTVKQRMVFRDITEDAFTWDWQSSTDGGQTWKTNWQIAYKRR